MTKANPMASQTQNNVKNNFNTYSNFPQNLQSSEHQQIVMNMYKLRLCYASYHYHFHHNHITIILLQTPFIVVQDQLEDVTYLNGTSYVLGFPKTKRNKGCFTLWPCHLHLKVSYGKRSNVETQKYFTMQKYNLQKILKKKPKSIKIL
jgi:hypothetical protein